MNRIILLIERTAAMLEQRYPVESTALADLSRTLDLSFDEFCCFQEVKSLAFAQGRLTLDEANYIYAALGGSPKHFNSQPLATKLALTDLFANLIN